ncbi:hypothetical protein CLU79DRAFT_698691, partial [Phycomyces nitens]
LSDHVRSAQRFNPYHKDPESTFKKKDQVYPKNLLILMSSRSAVYSFITMQCNLSIKQAQFQLEEKFKAKTGCKMPN